MNNKNNLQIVQGNELVEASYSLGIDEMRLISLACSKVDSRKKSPGLISVSPQEFAGYFHLPMQNVHRNLVNSVKTLASKTLTIPLDGKRNAVIPWLSLGIYERQPHCGSHVVIEFSKYVSPFLFELEERFTTLKFEYVTHLNTPFSFRLYQWLKEGEKLNKHKRGSAIAVELSLSWMKDKSGLSESYGIWMDFKNRVVVPALEKINHHTDISVTFEPRKTGKSVTSIEFIYINEKNGEAKPVRPRLIRRPHAKKNSHLEGEWARKNLNLLRTYELQLQNYDNSLQLDIKDIRKCVQYAKIVGDKDGVKYFESQLNRRGVHANLF